MSEENKKPDFDLFVLQGNLRELRLKSRVLKGRFPFKNGVYKSTNPEATKELMDLIVSQPNIAALVQHLSADHAAAKAKQLLANRNLGGAVSGTVTSADVRRQAHEQMRARDAEMQNVQADPDAAAAMQEQIRNDDMQLTEAAHGGVADMTGFNPTSDDEKVDADKQSAASEGKKAFASLVKGG